MPLFDRAEFQFCFKPAGCTGNPPPRKRRLIGQRAGDTRTCCPSSWDQCLPRTEKFAERDRLWEEGDPAYYALSDALQYFGNVAFREPVPAYKHSAAVFLHSTGRMPTDLPHPRNPQRPPWEVEILQDCARRLGL